MTVVKEIRFGILLFTSFLISCSSPESNDLDTPSTSTASTIQFKNVTLEAGLGDFRHETGAFGKKWMPEIVGSGGGFIDYDSDGWLDILIVGGGNWEQHPTKDVRVLWLYRNNGDGTFSLKTDEAGLGNVSTYGFGITCADYDNDLDQDFLLTTVFENMLFRNDSGVFTEIGKYAGIANESAWSTSALFFDADLDGWLDIYVCNYVEWSPETDMFCTADGINKEYCTPLLSTGIPGRFYHNNSDGTFSDWTQRAGFLPAPGKGLGVAETDFNQDGWPDLVVASDTERDLLYENNGDGTFTENGLLKGLAFDEVGRASAGMGIDVGVVDTTAHVSVFIGNFSNEMIGVFRYSSAGLFDTRASLSRIGHASLQRLTFGLFLFDADFDRDLDLFAGNGHIQPMMRDGTTFRQLPQLYLNHGDGTFAESSLSIGGPFLDSLVCRSSSFGDFDRDGDQDILLTENGGPAHLWRNDSEGNNFLRVRLRGVEGNRDAVDSQLVGVVEHLRMYRRVRTGGSYLSNSEKTIVFGLGASNKLDSLIVQWPGGNTDRFFHLKANQEIAIVQGESVYQRVPLPGLQE